MVDYEKLDSEIVWDETRSSKPCLCMTRLNQKHSAWEVDFEKLSQKELASCSCFGEYGMGQVVVVGMCNI